MENTNLHFFPFNTVTRKPIESYDNVQGFWVESYPEFLSEALSMVPGVRVYPYFNNISQNEETGETGFSNWSLDALGYMVGTRRHPMEGYGVTGELFFDETTECFVRVIIFDVNGLAVLKKADSRFSLEKLPSVAVYSVIKLIIKACRLDNRQKENLTIPKSMIRTPGAFLVYLKIRDMLRKRNFMPDVVTKKRVLSSFHECFNRQPDFMVQAFMFLDFVEAIPRPGREKHGAEIDRILGLMEDKRRVSDALLADANACQERGDFERAVSNYNRMILLEPEDMVAYYNRAFANGRHLGRPDLAVSDFSKVIEANPRDDEAYYNRAVSYFMMKDYAGAWDDVKKVEELGATIEPEFLKRLRDASGMNA